MLSFLAFVLMVFGARARLLSLVELIQGSSRDEVLSDLWTGAREPAGALQPTLEGIAAVDLPASAHCAPDHLAGRQILHNPHLLGGKVIHNRRGL